MFGDNTDWIEALQVGDVVAIKASDIGGVSYRLLKVQKVTEKQVHIGDNPEQVTKFWKKDGLRVGKQGWHHVFLEQATPELIAQVKAKNLRDGLLYKLRKVNWNDVSTEVLQNVYVLVQDKIK